jgi:hypothetical protein
MIGETGGIVDRGSSSLPEAGSRGGAGARAGPVGRPLGRGLAPAGSRGAPAEFQYRKRPRLDGTEMIMERRSIFLFSILSGALGVAACAPPLPSPASATEPFGESFWNAWGDGQAEVSSYDLTFPRYGELREGTAVCVFVTETFSSESRVKADPGRHAASDEFPVMKLNLVQDFATGIYDYNLMASAFVALVPWNGRPAGAPAKISFSSQEWCGHVYEQILPRERTVDHVLHSYFDGEADRSRTLEYPENGFLEDALFHWARGFAAPFLDPGESREVRLLRSTETSRLRHLPPEWENATLARSGDEREIRVPAGTFAVETLSVEIEGRPSWTFFVERRPPRRIARWERDDGRRADLVASERLEYWEMNGKRFEEALSRIGLSPRPPRTP